MYNFGDKKVDYFDNAFNDLINFEFKWNAKQKSKEEVFSRYDSILNNEMAGYGTLNYLSSHDDGQPYDAKREKPYETATWLLLAPGASQIYYGDESARSLVIEGTVGDATLRSFMNWDAMIHDTEAKAVLSHWQKLGRFRTNHPSVGAGRHQMIAETPYTFSRLYVNEGYSDKVVIALDLKKGKKTISVGTIFENGSEVRDAYSNQTAKVIDGNVVLDSDFDLVLLEKL